MLIKISNILGGCSDLSCDHSSVKMEPGDLFSIEGVALPSFYLRINHSSPNKSLNWPGFSR